eukprot:TRINITY_DN1489_c0_g2_i2.p1 TRINITY_DN1489_c0_g2~~TRINITY_DN1489_c0_g2_i2.p1  ORF type:complete len:453 (+),score=67.54 TRINITY_DN1489_c0_g2_i2:77-1360(+)
MPDDAPRSPRSPMSPMSPSHRELRPKDKLVFGCATVALVMVAAMIVALIYLDQQDPFQSVGTNITLEKRAPDGVLLAFLSVGCILTMFAFAVFVSSAWRHLVQAALEDTMRRQHRLQNGVIFTCRRRPTPKEDRSDQDPCSVKLRRLARQVYSSLLLLPVWLNVVLAVLALLVVGFGALGFMLMVGMAHMPRERDDPAWTEVSWQVICACFTAVALWRHPQRLSFLLNLIRQRYTQPGQCGEGDGPDDGRYAALLFLEVKEAWVLCVLRNGNCFFQYIVCVFMWGWLPRCWEEERLLFRDCESRPGWAVPVFLVLSMGCDIAQGVFKGKAEKSLCRMYVIGEYDPNEDATTGDDPVTEVTSAPGRRDEGDESTEEHWPAEGEADGNRTTEPFGSPLGDEPGGRAEQAAHLAVSQLRQPVVRGGTEAG